MAVNLLKLYQELKTAGLEPYIFGTDQDGIISWRPEAAQQQFDQAAVIVAAHDPTDTEQQAIAASKTLRTSQVKSDFNVLAPKARAFYNSLSGAQRAAIGNTLDNWGSATAVQKADALLAVDALIIIGLEALWLQDEKSY